MKFEAGHTKKGGRAKGTLNKATVKLTDAITDLVEGNIDKVSDWIEEVAKTDPHKACMIVINLLEYKAPKLARTELVGNDKKPLSIEITKTYDKE